MLYRVLQPGESTVIEARDAIDLRLGDAGALKYIINGAPGRILGGSGEVVSIRITTENARSFQADTRRPRSSGMTHHENLAKTPQKP